LESRKYLFLQQKLTFRVLGVSLTD